MIGIRRKKVEITAISGCFYPKSVKYVQNLEIDRPQSSKVRKIFHLAPGSPEISELIEVPL